MSNTHALLAVCRLLYEEADRTVLLLGAAALLVGLGGLLAGLSPLALKGMIDAISIEGRQVDWTLSGPVTALGACYIAALSIGRLLTELHPLVACRAEQRLIARLSRRFFAQVLDLNMSFHLRQPGGAVLHSLVQANAGCQLITGHVVGSFLPVLIEFTTTVVVLVHLGQPPLVATFCVTAVAYLLIFARGAAPLMQRGEAVSGANQKTYGLIAESLLNCEALKCYSAEGQARRRLETSTRQVEQAWYRLQALRTRTGTCAAAIFAISVTASLLLAAQSVREGTLTVGGFVLTNVYILQIVRPLETLGAAVRDVAQALGFLRPLLIVLEEPDESAEVAQAAAAVQGGAQTPELATSAWIRGGRASRIQLDGVRFGYEAHRPVLRDLNLDLAAGQSLGIVGASGSGKSSIVKLLLRLHTPQHGRILLDGVSIAAMDVKDLRSRLAVVAQESALFNDTIANNIALGRPDATRMEIEQAARHACLHDLIVSLPAGYETPVGERGLRLSGGERQRVAIARALLKRSRTYLFDEATSMLDSMTEARIVNNLREALSGCSTITVAHRLSAVMHADEILVLHAGRVAERGRHQDLVALDGAYARMWRLQASSVHR